MGEIENLIGLLSEVDRAVAENPTLVPQVADLLAPGKESAVADWSERLGQSFEAPSAIGSLPDVDSALAAMATEAPPPSLRYRRLLAIAGLVRSRPEQFGLDGPDRGKVAAALRPVMRDARLGQADVALALFSRAKLSGGRGAACELLSQTIAHGLVDARLHTSLRLVPAAVGNRNVTSRFGTFVPVPGIGCDDVDELLEPTCWPSLSPVWKSMKPLDGRSEGLSVGEHRLYQEVFTVTPRLQLTPILEFVRQDLTADRRARSLEYRLAMKHEQSTRELIQVDEGIILTRVVDDELHITTTKRLLFAPPFDGPGLVLVSDNIGYLDAFEDMVEASIAQCDGQSS
jgi:hypothetical protein